MDDIEISEQDAQELLRQMEMQAQAGGANLGSFPEPPNKDTLLKFMRDVIDQEDDLKLSKTANFREEEVGRPKAPVLVYADLASYADTEGYDLVSTFLNHKAGLVATMSLGRKGKLLDTLFTVRRETKNLGTPRTTTKSGMFGGQTVVKEGDS